MMRHFDKYQHLLGGRQCLGTGTHGLVLSVDLDCRLSALTSVCEAREKNVVWDWTAVASGSHM